MFFKIICNDDEKLSITKNNIKYNIIFNTSDKNPSHVKDLINLKNFDDENLIFFLKQKNIYFFLIIWSTDRLFVAVDQVASKNTLYSKKNGLLKVLTSKPNNCEFDNSVKDEIYYSGYSIDNYSIFKDYKCLRPGEYLSIKNKELKIKKWNLFYPIFLKEKIKNNEEIFHDILLKEFNDIKKNSLNKKIMVPLSAGLDSRLIVCFLKYHNFEVETFTYGYQNKKDFKIADQISKSLKIKNYKIVMDKQHSSIYKSDYFKEYLSFRDIGIRANNFGDFGPLFYLKKKINLEEFQIINGQSGDFIAGNHLPVEILEKNKNFRDQLNNILDYIIEKHYTLWPGIEDQKKIKILNKIEEIYFSKVQSQNDIASSYENYEFENRQSKWVVGQQNVYDYFDISWELPLWKTKIMDFFSNKMTFEEKKHEYFYKEFLLKKNFYQVWNKIEINPNETFSIKLKIIRFLFKFIFFLFGKKYWHRFQNSYLRYFMDTTGVFYLINFLEYLKLKKKPKNSISLISKKYIYNYFDKI